jgi:hypothetical protein
MKIGRNAPCPCGSGLKYKKCCLNKEEIKIDLYSTKRTAEPFKRELYNLLFPCSLIDSENIKYVYEEMKEIIKTSFEKTASYFQCKDDFFCFIIKFYHKRYGKVPTKHYPYYLLSFFYSSEFLPDFANVKCEINEDNVYNEMNSLHEAIEMLMIMMPRDIAKGLIIRIIYSKNKDIKFVVDGNKENKEKMIHYESHYFNYSKESLFSGVTYLTYYLAELPQNSMNYAVFVKNYQGDLGKTVILIWNPKIITNKTQDLMHKILSVANFIFIDLFKDIVPGRLKVDSINRCEFFLFFFCLPIFLLDFCAKDCAIYNFNEFIDEYIYYIRKHCNIGYFSMNKESSDLPLSLPELNNEQLEQDIFKFLYHQGIDKKKLLKNSKFDLNSINKSRSVKNVDEASKSSNEHPTIALEPEWQHISVESLKLFIEYFFVMENNNSEKTGNFFENSSELGFIFENHIGIPHVNSHSILSRLLLALERFTLKVINKYKGGPLTGKLGHRFERFVEKFLEAHDFHIIRSEMSDPDVIAIHDNVLYAIECKSWLTDVEYTFGLEYIEHFNKKEEAIFKAKDQAKKWAGKIPSDISIPSDVKKIQPVVMVPYPVFSYPYINKKLEIDDDNIPTVTPHDFVELLKKTSLVEKM